MKKKPERVAIAIQLATAVDDTLPPAVLLRRWCRAALATQGIAAAEACIRIVGGRESAALNKRYRGKSGATNVLSFPAGWTNAAGGRVLGDIVICAPVVRREAREQCKSPRAHWAHLTVHGTLHLLGFDHLQSAEARQMETLEIRILHQLGFDNPYN